MSVQPRTVSVITIDPAHSPSPPGDGSPLRGLLYPLWVLAIEIKPYPGARARSIWFSVDAVRGVPLPVKEPPITDDEPVPEGARLLDGVDEKTAIDTTLHFVKEGLGSVAGWLARVSAHDTRKVYKLFWIVNSGTGDQLVDSRSGKTIPLPDDFA